MSHSRVLILNKSQLQSRQVLAQNLKFHALVILWLNNVE